MAGAYSANGNKTIAASTTLMGVSQPASALKRLKIFFIQLGSSATADNAYKATVKRSTAAGTSTSWTPTLLDPADGAASAVSGYNHTVEPTYTASSELLIIDAHQRAVYQWYAAPGSEIIVPVTNSNGIGIFTSSVTTGFAQDGVVHWYE